MADLAKLEAKFWKALKSDRTLMLGLTDVEEGHSQPMTAQIEGDEGGPIWIFSAKGVDLVQATGAGHRAMAHFASKDHELFATIHGRLVPDNDQDTIERLWNPFVAAWCEGGKDDPKLQLLRFEPERAQIWLNEHSLFAGVKVLMGRDPKQDYQDKVGEVRLS